MRTLGPNDIIFIIAAARWTLLLSLAAFVGGAIGGVLVALARTSVFAWLRVVATGYIKLFQGTPLLCSFSWPFLRRVCLAGRSIPGWRPRSGFP